MSATTMPGSTRSSPNKKAISRSILVLVSGAKCPYLWVKRSECSSSSALRVPSYLCSLSHYLPPGNLPEVVRQDPPSYPPLHPFFSVIETYIQPEGAI